MRFVKRNWEKIATDTISGVLVKLVAFVVVLGAGGFYVINKVVDGDTIKSLVGMIPTIAFMIYAFLLRHFQDILSWSNEKRKDKIKEQALKNENLKLERDLLQEKRQFSTSEKTEN